MCDIDCGRKCEQENEVEAKSNGKNDEIVDK
jgi:hypothetical protein